VIIIKNQKKKRLDRSFEILLHAMIITFITYMYHPKIFIRFGVLHFISIASLLGSFFIDKKILTFIFMFLFVIIKPISVNNKFIDTITGGKINYNMMDYFPLFPWFGLVLFGLFIGKNSDLTKIDKTFNFIDYTSLTKIGQNSLKLYTSHIILLMVIYNIKKMNTLYNK